MKQLATLNEQQRAAVTLPVGPILVKAGAGTGKTRVLTYRIAYLIDAHRVKPSTILALTFTNKAAKELRTRLHAMLGHATRGLTSGTFHAVCASLLRQYITERIGSYTSSFTIYAADEQLQVASDALDAATERPPTDMDAADVLRHISRAKSRLIRPRLKTRGAGAALDPFVMGCYRRYQRALEHANALDFDDLIVLTHQLLSEHPAVLDECQERWHHVLVDEYQDTDPAQYAILELLSRPHSINQSRSLFVVGDGMQAIYGFRNADYTIINAFTKDFPDATVCNLTLNYRSHQSILHAAYAVIRHSNTVVPMALEAASDATLARSCLHIVDARDSRDEADTIARTLNDMMLRGDTIASVAILYRTRHMSRPLETALRHARIPYRVRGATGFYDQAVIRDALAYLRVIANPADTLNLTRIANRPPRGIGAQSLAVITSFAAQHGITLCDTLALPAARAMLPPKAAQGASTLSGLLSRWQHLAMHSTYPPDHLLSDVLERSGYMAWLAERLEPNDLVDAQEHLRELVAAAEEQTDLSSFLQEIALVTNNDDDDEPNNPRVELLTIHAAKGLEWRTVFLVGLEEGTLPHERSLITPAGIEEERRLCYVALTRAGEALYLSWCAGRVRGKNAKPSRFLQEIEVYGKERMSQQPHTRKQ